MNGHGRVLSYCLVFVLLFVPFGLVSLPYVAFADDETYDLLIVGHEDFLEPLLELADWKTRTGMPAAVVSWQSYDRSYVSLWDAPERIKWGIKLAHEAHGVKYVMLVGDSDMLPVRYTMTDRVSNDSRAGAPVYGYGAYYAGDLYYADLYKQDGSFDNWDFNGNHLYGELHGEYFTDDIVNVDRIDMIPDVAVGRVPAATVDEVENYVDKVINYEWRTYGETRSGTTFEWFKSALFVVPYNLNDDLDDIFLAAKENIVDDSLTSARDFEIVRLYDARVSGAAGITDGAPIEDTIKWWISRGVGFVNYGGHGNRDVWDNCFYTWTVDNRTFGYSRLPICVSMGCGTAQFAVQPPYETYVDVSGATHLGINNGELWPVSLTLPQPAALQADIHDSFPEHMLCYHATKGAIAYLGCVTGAQAWSKYLDEFFFEGYHEPYAYDGGQVVVTLGEMWRNMVTQYCDTVKTMSQRTLGQIGRGETSIRASGDWFLVAGYHQPIKFVLFGDPSLRVGGLTNRPPRATLTLISDLTVNEGTRCTFDSADFRFTDLEGAPLSYRWDVDCDGVWDGDWSSVSTVSHTFSDDFNGELRFQASDGAYQSVVCTRRIHVLNVAPVLNVHTGLPFGTGTMPCYRVGEDKRVRFDLLIDDPGDDTFTYSWSFGVGADPETSTQHSPTVTFEGPEASAFAFESTIKTYNVTLTVADDDGGSASYRLTMEVVHSGLLDRMGGILGLMGISIAVIVIGGAVAFWRLRLARRERREEHRPL